ncbi:hypothetical protein D9613_008974 [Agrocybe pediades]|uniref:HMG box domain-containing protein n=1 Tax=Agrocybe pediades TaxID=84607 RepID=A0A8H4R3F4_9AGAR|nr:hypothetical protein D9613_008974 [Agrocybe pediades]
MPRSRTSKATAKVTPTAASKPRRNKKSPNYVPRPPNSFILFRAHMRKQLPPVSPGRPPRTLQEESRLIGAMWHAASKDVRQEYVSLQEQAKENHRLRHPDYKFSPRTSTVDHENERVHQRVGSSSSASGAASSWLAAGELCKQPCPDLAYLADGVGLQSIEPSHHFLNCHVEQENRFLYCGEYTPDTLILDAGCQVQATVYSDQPTSLNPLWTHAPYSAPTLPQVSYPSFEHHNHSSSFVQGHQPLLGFFPLDLSMQQSLG